MTDPTPTTLRKITAVAAWLEPVRCQFRDGTSVHVVFSPGDATAYGLVFVPPGLPTALTAREWPRLPDGAAMLALLADTGGAGPRGTAIRINPAGDPYPSYVAEQIGNDNPYSITAIGVVWSLMVGVAPESVARVYGSAEFRQYGSSGDDIIASWSAVG